MRALLLRKPGQADLETVADPVLTGRKRIAQGPVRGILWQRSEFVPWHESTRHVSSHSGRRSIGYGRGRPGTGRRIVCGDERIGVPIHELPPMLFLSVRTFERLPVQPDSRCAKGWRTYRIHCDAARKALSRQADAERVVLGGTAYRGISCRHTGTCNRERHGCDLGLWGSGTWGRNSRKFSGCANDLYRCG